MTAGATARIRCEGRLEGALRRTGYAAIAGVDEAGRGSLFGPVFAAAVIFPRGSRIRGLRDSKLLSSAHREKLAAAIAGEALACAVASADEREIDRLNIYQASRLAMQRAVGLLEPQPDFLLVDAMTLQLDLPQRSLIKGDARVRAIAAASILAKVRRDECMRAWDVVYPQYGLARSKGYGTPEHLSALERCGPTAHHRFTFEPVRQWFAPAQMALSLIAEEAGR